MHDGGHLSARTMKEARLGTVCESVCPAATGVQSLRMPHIPSIPRRFVPPRGAVRALPATMLPAPFSCRPRREGSGDVESVESKSRDVARSRVASGSTLYTRHTLIRSYSSSTPRPASVHVYRQTVRVGSPIVTSRRVRGNDAFTRVQTLVASTIVVPVLVAPRHVE